MGNGEFWKKPIVPGMVPAWKPVNGEEKPEVGSGVRAAGASEAIRPRVNALGVKLDENGKVDLNGEVSSEKAQADAFKDYMGHVSGMIQKGAAAKKAGGVRRNYVSLEEDVEPDEAKVEAKPVARRSEAEWMMKRQDSGRKTPEAEAFEDMRNGSVMAERAQMPKADYEPMEDMSIPMVKVPPNGQSSIPIETPKKVKGLAGFTLMKDMATEEPPKKRPEKTDQEILNQLMGVLRPSNTSPKAEKDSYRERLLTVKQALNTNAANGLPDQAYLRRQRHVIDEALKNPGFETMGPREIAKSQIFKESGFQSIPAWDTDSKIAFINQRLKERGFTEMESRSDDWGDDWIRAFRRSNRELNIPLAEQAMIALGNEEWAWGSPI